jgi:hypothetical protein
VEQTATAGRSSSVHSGTAAQASERTAQPSRQERTKHPNASKQAAEVQTARTVHANDEAEERSGSAIEVTPGLVEKVTEPATVVSRGKESAEGPPPVMDNRPEMVASCGLRAHTKGTHVHESVSERQAAEAGC